MTIATKLPRKGESPKNSLLKPTANAPTANAPTVNAPLNWWTRKSLVIAAFVILAIFPHLVLRFGVQTTALISDVPLLATLVFGGFPMLYDLLRTLYVGDGINDAPAMMAATVGMAIGQNSDVTAEAAGVVIMDNSLTKVDEFMHISRRMRTIALPSAVGGMALSVIGMGFASTGYLTPVAGAVLQEVIDVAAVLNALRAAFPPKVIHDL